MFFRRAASGFLKTVRFSSANASATPSAYCRQNAEVSSLPLSGKRGSSHRSAFGIWQRHSSDCSFWILLYGPAAIILGINAQSALAEDVLYELSSEKNDETVDVTSLRKIEDGSITSNLHTSKWRVFTDKGRELFLQGRLDDAEKLFVSALEEAQKGFGEKDPHVASACNNLAELYRVKKEFHKAEPLYLQAIDVLEESFGEDDIRVASALHNLGQFYLMKRKLEKARSCYERALKIKGRVLGYSHTDYADTMHHLGIVLYLLENKEDSEALIVNSVRILEEAGQGESATCIKRLRYLAQLYLKSHRLAEAEKILRKILHIMEVSKGWDSLDTILAAEVLALTLQSVGSLRDSKELLERCFDARKALLPDDHIQFGANMLCQARVAVLNSKQLSNMDISEAISELNRAKDLLGHSIRIAQGVLNKFVKHKVIGDLRASKSTAKDAHEALIVLLQSYDTLGHLEISMQGFKESKKHLPTEAVNAFRQCIHAFKEFGHVRSLSDSMQIKAEYLSCLEHYLSFLSDSSADISEQSISSILQELKDEMKNIRAQISSDRKPRT